MTAVTVRGKGVFLQRWRVPPRSPANTAALPAPAAHHCLQPQPHAPPATRTPRPNPLCSSPSLDPKLARCRRAGPPTPLLRLPPAARRCHSPLRQIEKLKTKEKERKRMLIRIVDPTFFSHLHMGPTYLFFYFLLTSMPRQQNWARILPWDLL